MSKCIFGTMTSPGLQLSPENTVVGRVEAKDLDKLPLYYRLDGETVRLVHSLNHRTQQR